MSISHPAGDSKRQLPAIKNFFLYVVYHRIGMHWLGQPDRLNCLVLNCGHFPTVCAGRCVCQVYAGQQNQWLRFPTDLFMCFIDVLAK